MTKTYCPEMTLLIQTRSEEEGRHLLSSPDFLKSKEARQLISKTRNASYYRRRTTSPFPEWKRKGEQYGKI